MSKQADRIRASAASLAALEEDFSTPAPKQYPAVAKTMPPPANTQPSAAEKPVAVAPAPAAAPKPVVEAPAVEAKVAEPEPPKAEAIENAEEERPSRRVPKRAAKTEAPRAQQASRVGKVPLNIWTAEEKRRALKIHAVSQGTTLEELMNEALDDYMKKHKIRVG
jgi:hypothetical protein